jgi:hypothetical protein
LTGYQIVQELGLSFSRGRANVGFAAVMKTKSILISGLVVVIGLVIMGKIVSRRSAPQETARTSSQRMPTPEPLAASPVSASTEQSSNLATGTLPPPEMKADKAQPVTSALTQTSKPKELLHDPAARAALSLVGVDLEAETYWLGAIFDSSLPENEREDLMEDLNEEGLSDAKHPSPQDLPVILNRLVIIEEILPFADEFMVEHLGEAYKDLLNLADVTQGRGEPVR